MSKCWAEWRAVYRISPGERLPTDRLHGRTRSVRGRAPQQGNRRSPPSPYTDEQLAEYNLGTESVITRFDPLIRVEPTTPVDSNLATLLELAEFVVDPVIGKSSSLRRSSIVFGSSSDTSSAFSRQYETSRSVMGATMSYRSLRTSRISSTANENVLRFAMPVITIP